jgi:CRP-like cAMP-binding protein
MTKWHLESPLFSALTEQERRSISAEMQLEAYQKGQGIIVEDDPSEAMYFVDSGWVSIFSEQAGQKVILANLGPGSVLGEVDALLDRPYSATAEAASEVSIWSLNKSDLKELIIRQPAIGIKLSVALGSKVFQVTQYLAEYRLPEIPFFTQLSMEILLGLAERLQLKTYHKGDTICWLGAPGDEMYIIESGEVDVVLAAESEELPVPLEEGDLFGEMALLANKPYAATYRASSEIVLWSLSRTDFDELVSQFPPVRQALSRALSEHLSPEDRAMAEQRLETISLFIGLPPEVLTSVGQRLVLQHYPQGELIFSQGDPGDALFIIEMGEVKLASETPAGDATVAWLETADFFGEMALLTGKTRSVKAQAMTDTNLWVLYKNDYDELMVHHPAISLALGKVLSERLTVGFQETRPRATPTRMREMSLLADLTETELADVTRRLRPVEREAREVIVSLGEVGDRMYLIESGQVQTRTQTTDGRTMLAELAPGDLVGEMALLTGKPRMATAQALTAVQLWELEKADFDELTLKYPRFVLAISRALSERLEGTAAVEAPPKPEKVVRAKPAVKPQPRRKPTRPRVAEGIADVLQASLAWLVTRSAGVKLRLAVVGFLLLWLCGITFPATVISSVAVDANNLSAAFQTPTPSEAPNTEGVVETPVPTDTPTPTETSLPTPAEAARAVPFFDESADETPVTLALMPTDTPTATPIPPTPTATRRPATPTPRPPTATPEGSVMGVAAAAAPTVRVYDRYGAERDLAWAQHYYGAWIEYGQPANGGCYRIVELREQSGPSNIDVTVLDENGNLVPNLTLRFDWPAGEVSQATNAEGKVGFALGPGSYIHDREVGGPHTIRAVCEYPSDVARNFGMLAGTPHDHLNIVFQFVPTGR